MAFVACGLNHKAPLNLRERVVLPSAMQEKLLLRLQESSWVNEAAILSTCNRTEIYCDTDDPSMIPTWLAHEHQLSIEELSPYLYLYPGENGLRHTLRVASGLDSMMLGESQILGQMKSAFLQACQVGSIKNTLQPIFQFVFRASKRIRTESGIGNNPVSVAYAAKELIGQFFKDYKPLNVFIIGSGETSSLVVKYLKNAGVERFMIGSRTDSNAQSLAKIIEGTAVSITDIPAHLPKADVIISATTCPFPFITHNMVEQALMQRDLKPMFFLDLAVPRDIEANVGDIKGVQLFNIDDLEQVTQHGMSERQKAAAKAEQLIDVELDNYIRLHRSQRANNLICDYREKMQELTQQELQRSMKKISLGDCPYAVLTEFSERLQKKLTHSPTIGLKHAALDNRDELLDLAQYLLEPKPYEKYS